MPVEASLSVRLVRHRWVMSSLSFRNASVGLYFSSRRPWPSSQVLGPMPMTLMASTLGLTEADGEEIEFVIFGLCLQGPAAVADGAFDADRRRRRPNSVMMDADPFLGEGVEGNVVGLLAAGPEAQGMPSFDGEVVDVDAGVA